MLDALAADSEAACTRDSRPDCYSSSVARPLRVQRTCTIGIITRDLGDAHIRRPVMPVYEWQKGEFEITTDQARLDLDVIHDYLAQQSYWARGVPR